MRVPLPGRDYFPPRVLLRGAAQSSMEVIRGEARPQEPRGGHPALRPGPVSMPAMPPTPMMGVRPGLS